LTLGELAQVASGAFEGGRHFGSVQTLLDAFNDDLPHVRSVVVKGSRFMRMEQVVEAAMAHAAKGQERRHAN
jgi:UDP-N-acetylmuramoyl-tripeptide--D-alanyl-D-alanine ligase